MTDWLGWVAELPTVVFTVALSVIMVLDAIPLVGILVPSDVVVLTALGARGPLGGGSVFLSIMLGCLAGWSLTFLAGRHLGDRMRGSRVGRWIGESRWAAAERALRLEGTRMVMVAPFLPVLNTLVPLAAGGLRMSYRRFLGSATVGALLWGGLYVGLGLVGQAVGGVLGGTTTTMAVTIAIGLGFGWVALFGARRRLAVADAAAGATQDVAAVTIEALEGTERTVRNLSRSSSTQERGAPDDDTSGSAIDRRGAAARHGHPGNPRHDDAIRDRRRPDVAREEAAGRAPARRGVRLGGHDRDDREGGTAPHRRARRGDPWSRAGAHRLRRARSRRGTLGRGRRADRGAALR
jgi:membrane protein DedA with SNARE-associated domain